MSRARGPFLLLLVLLVLDGREAATTAISALSSESQAPSTAQGTLPSSGCPISKPIRAEPPKDPSADRFGFGDWNVNADRTIWVVSRNWRAGSDGNKVIWILAGTTLVITGRRLDAGSAPLRVDAPCCYLSGFQVTGLYFPTEGCWKVTAKAGSSELRLVTEVAPGSSVRKTSSMLSSRRIRLELANLQ